MRRIMWVGLVVLGGLVAGCGDAEPVGPAIAGGASATSQAALGQLAQYRAGSPGVTIGFAKKWIGPEGGVLRLGDFEVVVPAGALEQTVGVSLRLDVSGASRSYVRAELGPASLRFLAPVTLITPYLGTTAEGASGVAGRWNGQKWVELPSESTADGRLSAPLEEGGDVGTMTSSGYIIAGG